jgi:hypothetical protein
VRRVLHNPAYAGSSVFGRTRSTKTIAGLVQIQDLPRSDWIALVRDAHVGYMTWEDYERNEAQLAWNSQAYAPQRFSPPREGPALWTSGSSFAAEARERMTVRSHQRGGQRIVPDYLCQHKSIEQGHAPCQRLPGSARDPSDWGGAPRARDRRHPGADTGGARGTHPASGRSSALAPSAGGTRAI